MKNKTGSPVIRLKSIMHFYLVNLISNVIK